MLNYYYAQGAEQAMNELRKEADIFDGLVGKAKNFFVGHPNSLPSGMPKNLQSVVNPGHTQGLADEISTLGSRVREKAEGLYERATQPYRELDFMANSELPEVTGGSITQHHPSLAAAAAKAKAQAAADSEAKTILGQMRGGAHKLQEFAGEHIPELAGGAGLAAGLGGLGYGLSRASKARAAGQAAAAAQRSSRNMRAGGAAALAGGAGIAGLAMRNRKSED